MDNETEMQFVYALFLIVDKHRMLEAAGELRTLRYTADESLQERVEAAIQFWRCVKREISDAWTTTMLGNAPTPLMPQRDYQRLMSRVIDALTVGTDIEQAELNEALRAVAVRHVLRDEHRLGLLEERRRRRAR
jgi:hypothetical protein